MNSIQLKLSDRQMAAIDLVAREENKTRTEVMKEAIIHYVSRQKTSNASRDVFGLWKDQGIDALEYQEKIRSEWLRL